MRVVAVLGSGNEWLFFGGCGGRSPLPAVELPPAVAIDDQMGNAKRAAPPDGLGEAVTVRDRGCRIPGPASLPLPGAAAVRVRWDVLPGGRVLLFGAREGCDGCLRGGLHLGLSGRLDVPGCS